MVGTDSISRERLPEGESIMRHVVALLLLSILGACTQAGLLEKMSSPEDRALSIQTLNEVEEGDVGALSMRVPEEVRPQLSTAVPQMRAALPSPGRAQKTLVDARFAVRAMGGQTHREAYLAYELRGANKYALAQLTIVRVGGKALVRDLAVHRIDKPAAELSAFTFKNTSWLHYAVLLIAMLALVATVAAVIKIWRSGSFRRRWLWTLGAVLGLSKLTLNWRSGEFEFSPLFFQLFSVSAIKPGLLAPWLVSVSIPAVALYVLFKRQPDRLQTPAPDYT